MHRSDKERIVAQLTERLRTAPALIVADYRGLTMSEIDALRTRLLESGASFQVVKNTLTRRAAEDAGVEGLLGLLDGPSAIAFLEPDGDPVTVAKVLNEAARTTRILVVKGGVLEGRTMSDADVTSLATLPPPDVLRAQVAGAVVGPLMAVVGLFHAPLRELVGIVDARIRQLGEAGETPAADEAPAAAEASAPEPEASEEDGDPAEAGENETQEGES